MTSYQIISSAGVEMGVSEAATAAEALEEMARDAGYESQADAAAQVGPFDGTVRELEPGTLCDYDTAEAIRLATREELIASITAARTDGGAGVILVSGRRCYVSAS